MYRVRPNHWRPVGLFPLSENATCLWQFVFFFHHHVTHFSNALIQTQTPIELMANTLMKKDRAQG